MTIPSVWDAAPGHSKDKPHRIDDIHYSEEPGESSTILCHCGWSAEGPTPEHVERAYNLHRREVGLPSTVLTIRFHPWV